MINFQDFQSLLAVSLDPGQAARHLAVAFLCGFLVSRFYTWIIRRPAYTRSFTISLIALSLITGQVGRPGTGKSVIKESLKKKIIVAKIYFNDLSSIFF